LSKQAELVRRSLTSILIVAFTILPVIYSPWSFVCWLCIIHYVALIEFFKLQHPLKTADYIETAVLTGWLAITGYLAVHHQSPVVTLIGLPLLVFLIIARQFTWRSIAENGKARNLHILAGAMYISIPLWTGTLMVQQGYDFRLLLIPIFLIWINDSGAYLVGSRIGKRKIAPAISPGKSVEGTIGGAVLTIGLAFALTRIWPEVNQEYIWFLGILVPWFSLAGDLFESSLKRAAGVKDSGRILPGHGGMLDRYDSFLFVLPLSAAGYFIFVA
jgi:phosphatidate cytidylyltransferase